MDSWRVGIPPDYNAINAVINANQDSMRVWHAQASAYANSAYSNWEMLDYFEPGTQRFDSLMTDITTKTSFLEGGSRIVDKSALYHLHAEKIFNLDFGKITFGGMDEYTIQNQAAHFFVIQMVEQ